MIQKNFSNFSAWHYRAKLMPKIYNVNGVKEKIDYCIPLEKIKEDFATLKHAYFTDPRDQSPWNYHEWLLRQITPIQVIGASYSDGIVELKLSHKVRNFNRLTILPHGEPRDGAHGLFDYQIKNGQFEISDTLRIEIENGPKD